ncbi:MAG: hypothetical protein ACI4NE_01690 [Succinivibrio sp.]
MNLSEYNNVPEWLVNYIRMAMGGFYRQDFWGVQQNLSNSHVDNQAYLGTYFPRSFSALVDIVKKLNHDSKYFEVVKSKRNLRILCAGCGTGGDLCGMIHIIHELYPEISFELNMFDGNRDAIEICKTLLIKIAQKEKINITFGKVFTRTVKNIYCFKEIAGEFSDLDLVLTSKFINELLSFWKQPYYDFVNIFSESICEEGIIILVDVTSKNDHEEYIPIILNRELNRVTIENDLSSILPLQCHANKDCNCSCYSRYNNPGHRECYTFRIIGKKEFASKIVGSVESGYYLKNSVSDEYCRVDNTIRSLQIF